MDEKKEILDEIFELLNTRSFVKLRAVLEEMNPADIAAVLDTLDEKEMPLVYRILPKDLASDVFAYMDSDKKELLIRSFSDFELKEVIDDLFLDDTVDMIEEMPANVVARVLQAADPAVRKQINELLKYPEDSAGGIMTVEYVSLKRILPWRRRSGKYAARVSTKETVYTCYVTENRKLIGTVSVKELLIADDDRIVSDIMETNVISIDAYEDKEIVAQTFSKYDVLALPVVDKDGRLVGIVTVDDAMDVMEDEATEDIEKNGGYDAERQTVLKNRCFSAYG